MRDNLRLLLEKASDVNIGVAFITKAGLAEIMQSLRQVASRGQVRIVTGLYQCVTEPTALWILLRAQNETDGRLSVRLSAEERFHRKLYFVSGKSKLTAVVGSSNLTEGGLFRGRESNIMISVPARSRGLSRLRSVFERDWNEHSVPLSRRRIKAYENYLSTRSVQNRKATRIPLRKILGREAIHRRPVATPAQTVIYWKTCTNSYCEDQTCETVQRETNWDKKRYEWMGVGSHPFKTGDKILHFDFKGHKAQIVEVRDIARLAVWTPDGRHFVAYTLIEGSSERQLGSLWAKLKSTGVIKNQGEAQRRSRIKPEIWDRLLSLFRKR